MLRARSALVIGPPVPSLAHWGRSADADLVYRTLVTFGPGTATDLEREFGMPRRRVAGALDELASIGAACDPPAHLPARRLLGGKPAGSGRPRDVAIDA